MNINYAKYTLLYTFNKNGLGQVHLVEGDQAKAKREDILMECGGTVEEKDFYNTGSRTFVVLDVILHINAIKERTHVSVHCYTTIFSQMKELGLLED